MALTEFVTETDYGSMHVTAEQVRIHATSDQLQAWAQRPGLMWPCSALDDYDEVTAVFDGNGLCDLTIRESNGLADDDLTADELSAWACDVARATLPTRHPAWVPLVGQFEGTSR